MKKTVFKWKKNFFVIGLLPYNNTEYAFPSSSYQFISNPKNLNTKIFLSTKHTFKYRVYDYKLIV